MKCSVGMSLRALVINALPPSVRVGELRTTVITLCVQSRRRRASLELAAETFQDLATLRTILSFHLSSRRVSHGHGVLERQKTIMLTRNRLLGTSEQQRFL